MEELFKPESFPEQFLSVIKDCQLIFDVVNSLTHSNITEKTEILLNHLSNFDFEYKYFIFFSAFKDSFASSACMLPYTAPLVYEVARNAVEKQWNISLAKSEIEKSDDIYTLLIQYNPLVIAHIVRLKLLPYQSFLQLIAAQFKSNPRLYTDCFHVIMDVIPEQVRNPTYGAMLNTKLSFPKPDFTFDFYLKNKEEIIRELFDPFNADPKLFYQISVIHDDLEAYKLEYYNAKTPNSPIVITLGNLLMQGQDLFIFPFAVSARSICHFIIDNHSTIESLSEKICSVCHDLEIIEYLSKKVCFQHSHYILLISRNITEITKWCLQRINLLFGKRLTTNVLSPFSAIACSKHLNDNMPNAIDCVYAPYEYPIYLLNMVFSLSVVSHCYEFGFSYVIEFSMKKYAKILDPCFLSDFTTPHVSRHLLKHYFLNAGPLNKKETTKILKKIILNTDPTILANFLKYMPTKYLNMIDTDGFTLPCYWVKMDAYDNLLALINIPGIDWNNSLHPNLASPIHYAAKSQNEKMIKLLLLTGVIDVNRPDEYGRLPLDYACNPRVAKLLIKAGAHYSEDFDPMMFNKNFKVVFSDPGKQISSLFSLLTTADGFTEKSKSVVIWGPSYLINDKWGIVDND